MKTMNTRTVLIIVILVLSHISLLQGKSQGNSKIGRMPIRSIDEEDEGQQRKRRSYDKSEQGESSEYSSKSSKNSPISVWGIIALIVVAGFGLFYRIKIYVTHRQLGGSYRNLVNSQIVRHPYHMINSRRKS